REEKGGRRGGRKKRKKKGGERGKGGSGNGTGKRDMCFGQDDEADLCTALRASEGNDLVKQAILEGISRKPKGHDFVIDRDHNDPAVSRHMSVTGG
ncbi:MAG: GTP 3',8-cyclase MoaA, partial [Geminicoccaceae bacterium]